MTTSSVSTYNLLQATSSSEALRRTLYQRPYFLCPVSFFLSYLDNLGLLDLLPSTCNYRRQPSDPTKLSVRTAFKSAEHTTHAASRMQVVDLKPGHWLPFMCIIRQSKEFQAIWDHGNSLSEHNRAPSSWKMPPQIHRNPGLGIFPALTLHALQSNQTQPFVVSVPGPHYKTAPIV